jgi:hypothetical protein
MFEGTRVSAKWAKLRRTELPSAHINAVVSIDYRIVDLGVDVGGDNILATFRLGIVRLDTSEAICLEMCSTDAKRLLEDLQHELEDFARRQQRRARAEDD